MNKSVIKRRNSGFTLIELIIAVLLSTILLAGMGALLHAAFSSYEFNTDLTDKTQTIRAAINRITREIRNADNVSWVNGNQLVITTGTSSTTYTYSSSAKTLTYSDGSTTSTVLSPDYGTSVEDITVSFITPAEQTDSTLLVQLIFTLNLGDGDITITGSASPRRNHLYIPKTF